MEVRPREFCQAALPTIVAAPAGLPRFRVDCETICHADTAALERWLTHKAGQLVALDFEAPTADIFLPEWEPFREFSLKLLSRIERPFLAVEPHSLILPILGTLECVSIARTDTSVHVCVPIDAFQKYLLEKNREALSLTQDEQHRQLYAMLHISRLFGFEDEDWLEP